MGKPHTFQITQLRDAKFSDERVEDVWPVLYASAEDAKAEFDPARMFEHTDDEDRPLYYLRELNDAGIEIGFAGLAA